jgi:hypothetical protein
LTRLPRRRARQALPLDGFPIHPGWRFTKNVELHLISSPRFAGLAIRFGAAPPPAAPPKLSVRTILIKSGLKRKNAKILKNFYLTQMAHPVISVKNRFQLPECAIKKAIP